MHKPSFACAFWDSLRGSGTHGARPVPPYLGPLLGKNQNGGTPVNASVGNWSGGLGFVGSCMLAATGQCAVFAIRASQAAPSSSGGVSSSRPPGGGASVWAGPPGAGSETGCSQVGTGPCLRERLSSGIGRRVCGPSGRTPQCIGKPLHLPPAWKRLLAFVRCCGSYQCAAGLQAFSVCDVMFVI